MEGKIFSNLNPSKTGINFMNTLTENDSINYFTFPYLYQGGGIATGDINNDGLLDMYFTGNMVDNKLYLNKGNLQFEDITDKAGVSGDKRWYTGVTMADINGDGFLDIYCSVGGKYQPKQNQLFLNKGDGTFVEKAKEFSIDDIGDSVQGTFFDYDKDGDLDLYVANYPPTNFSTPTYYYSFLMKNVKDEQSDHLYRNDGNTFTDVTEEAHLKSFGLTLSTTVGDLNNDSWPDLYVSNDFDTPDYMYLNNQDGTFREVVKKATSHTAFYGMGSDVSDINNDGNLDIFQVDMDAKSNRRKKANMASMNPTLFWSTVNAGFHYQYMNNSMQLNIGTTDDGIPHFSDVSRITGTSSTDWSWGPIIADFDNDGNKDLFVANGTRREVNNNDYFNNLKKVKLTKDSLLKRSLMIPSEKMDNFMFKNNGNLDFEEVNDKWGIKYKGFSNGAVYADLDNDGDLEIVINNIDDHASFFENKSSEKNNFIKIKFNGISKNRFGLGNRVFVKTGDKEQMQELTLSRGFQSSVAPELHFGLNQSKKIDELKVIWTDGRSEILKDVPVNQTMVLQYVNAKMIDKKNEVIPTKLFVDLTNSFPEFKHQENENDDFAKQVLLPHKMSSFGPALAVGDLNNDGLDDYFVGGSHGYSAEMFFQTKNGFAKQEVAAFMTDESSEDVGAVIFDADQDGDNDLYVVSGGYEFEPQSKDLQDRLYINDGKGNFSKAEENALPEMLSSGSRVYHADFDKDGKEDLLVLGRQIPGNYPFPAKTYLLKNSTVNGMVKFEENSQIIEDKFDNLGMATSAVITDFNNDDWLDIIVVGEWMPIKVFKNNKTGFEEVSEQMGLTLDTTAWWWSISQGDFDKDGDMDYIVGNNGLNYKYKATDDETFDIFVNDFDKNNEEDIVLSYYNEGKQFPVRGRSCSSQQIPAIKTKFKNFETFAEATLADVYTKESLDASMHYKIKSFASIYLENKGDRFVIHKLPIEAQISSINQILIDDYDKDGNLDALIAGNLYVSEVETPRNDAGYGLFLKGDSKGDFDAVRVSKSGFYVPGDVKDMATIKVKGETYIIAAKNNDFLQFIKIEKG
jgi:hypothetical protein